MEIREIPEAVQRLIDQSPSYIREVADAIRKHHPSVVCTIARGSSDHAAAYLKYAIELSCGIPVASIGPSVSSVYGASLNLEMAATISISQSGGSPDIVRMTESARESGATTVVLTNNTNSPLASACDYPLDIRAGPELSVAATKTFITSIVAGLMLLARWQNDTKLEDAIKRLPDQSSKAIGCDWSLLIERLRNEQSLYVLGRGPSMALSNEVALKFKETCQIHAESYSSAEVLHGPVSIVGSGYPVLVLAARDAAESAVVDVADSLAGQGADAFVTSGLGRAAKQLPFASTGHSLTDPLLLIVSFYVFIERLARERGLNPDNPPHLRKVTETR